jgi:transposase
MRRYKPNKQSTTTKKTIKVQKLDPQMDVINPHCAGIDIGSRSHFVAVPNGCCDVPVREFSSTTSGLLEMVNWLKECKIVSVAMESTGSYWIPVYEILEAAGFDVCLVNAYFVKSVPGRKSDVKDCQWVQKLHSYGLLSKSFRPKDHCLKLRSLTRQHSSLIEHRSPHILHMQKALHEMNIQLATHVRDITGLTGMRIITAILNGERDENEFAKLVHANCKNSVKAITDSLKGNYREEHLFTLKQARDLYFYYTEKISECEVEINKALEQLLVRKQMESLIENNSVHDVKSATLQATNHSKGKKKSMKAHHDDIKGIKKSKKGISFLAGPLLSKIVGTDLIGVPGIDQATALKIIGELGGSVDAWPTAKHFASWLGLCPGNKVSGGQIISSKTKRCVNRLAGLLRQAANGLWNAKCYLGAFLRRMNSRLGGMEAITCTAHKLARIIYVMIKEGKQYEELGEEYYETAYQKRRYAALERQAKEMGMKLVPEA